MWAPGWVEMAVVLIYPAVHVPIYMAHRRNEKNNKQSKVWAAVLLSFLPSPVGGILYVKGVIVALISFLIFNTIRFVFSVMSISLFFPLVWVGVIVYTGILANNRNNRLTEELGDTMLK
ncbi:MAG: hypothetical protein ACUZ77_01585 [Candidatus Brocadiales bacterium]